MIKLYGLEGEDVEGNIEIISVSLTPYQCQCWVCELEDSIGMSLLDENNKWKPYTTSVYLCDVPDLHESGADLTFDVEKGKIVGKGIVDIYEGGTFELSKDDLIKYLKEHSEVLLKDYSHLNEIIQSI